MVVSGAAIGSARRAVHVGLSLWGEGGADEPCVGKRWCPFWKPCTRACPNLATPLMVVYPDFTLQMVIWSRSWKTLEDEPEE